MDQNETWCGGSPRPRLHCVRSAPSSPSPKWLSPSPIFAHVCCGQMASWIKMPLGTEVGPPHATLCYMGTHYPKKAGDSSRHFSAHVLWPNGWMDQDATWCGGRPQHRPHCVRWAPTFSLPPPKKRGTAPNFRPMSVVAKRLDIRFLQVSENWKWQGNLSGQGKSGKMQK